jgi:hypothetical protein
MDDHARNKKSKTPLIYYRKMRTMKQNTGDPAYCGTVAEFQQLVSTDCGLVEFLRNDQVMRFYLDIDSVPIVNGDVRSAMLIVLGYIQ